MGGIDRFYLWYPDSGAADLECAGFHESGNADCRAGLCRLMIGFIDDFIIVVQKNNRGLSPKMRNFWCRVC